MIQMSYVPLALAAVLVATLRLYLFPANLESKLVDLAREVPSTLREMNSNSSANADASNSGGYAIPLSNRESKEALRKQ